MKELIDMLRNQAATVTGYGVPDGSDEAILAGQFMTAADALERAEALAEALHNMIELGGPQMPESDDVNAITLRLARESLTAYREVSHG